jgi:HK97 family phage portal protein
MTTNLNLSAKAHVSRVLTDWAGARPGAFERMGVKNATVVSSNNDAMMDLFQNIPSPSGYAVTDKTAMQVSTVYACLSKLSGAIQQLPVNKYRFDANNDREMSARDSLWWMLNESPAPAWTAASWKEWIVRCVALRGDQHTEILRSRIGSSYGVVIGFKVHHPDNTQVRRNPADLSRLVYDVMDASTGKGYTVDQDDMLHFSGFGFDGMRSLSAIQTAAKSGIGNALAAADYTGKSIGEGAMPQISIQYANKMGQDQQKLLRDSFNSTYSPSNGGRKLFLMLIEGAKVQELSLSPVDMELMSSRRFEREDICQALGVPPILIGDNDKTSSWGTGIEQITLGFVKYTVKPHLNRWEEELNRKLFRNAGPFLEFDLDELLRGDSKAQAEADRAALGGAQGDGYKTVNEVRRSRNLPPIDGGDQLYKVAAKPAAAAAP